MFLKTFAVTLLFSLSQAFHAAADAQWELIRKAKAGEVLSLENLRAGLSSVPVVPVQVDARPSPQLLLADAPEYFPHDGIALREKVQPGVVRLYIYHVPESSGARKTITAIIENTSRTNLNFRFLNYAFPKPGKNYYQIGKQGLVDYFTSQPSAETRVLAPGRRLPIDPAMDNAIVSKDDLVHGFYEFELDQPAAIYVLQRDPDQANDAAVDTLPRLVRKGRAGGAGRGLFLTNNFSVVNTSVIDTTNGVARVIVADGKRDPWIRGTDSIDESDEALNKGNYGTIYNIRLKWTSSDGRDLALLAPHPYKGGYCYHQALAVKVSEGEFPGGLVQLPANRISYGGNGEMALVQRFPAPPKGETAEIEIVYSPPGASCLPTPFLLVPYGKQ
ncbi:MAG: copper amine oxidase [Limisphaerales bacterium]